MLAIHGYAHDLLRQAGQADLPIREDVVVATLGARLLPYSKARRILENLHHWEYANTVPGLSFIFDGVPYLCYADSLSLVERRSVIMHECGHVFLGHIAQDGILGKSYDTALEDAQEQEANEFAVAALAPTHLLRAYGLTSSQDIQRVCRVSEADASEAITSLSEITQSAPIHKHTILGALAVAALVLFIFFSIPIEEDAPAASLPLPSPTPSARVDGTDMLYWTQGGEVYHASRDCPALKNAAYPVQSGYIDEAELYKSRPCKLCSDVQ